VPDQRTGPCGPVIAAGIVWMMRCPVMQLSATVEDMDITDRQATGTARAVYLTVNNCGYALALIRPG
jgi:hypothetical protein